VAAVEDSAGPVVHRLRVRYAECDMQGHVFNAHYLTWMDIAHTELWRAAAGPYSRLTEAGLEFVVAEVAARWTGSARYDEEIDIAVALEPLTTTSMTSRHRILRGDEVLVVAQMRHVCVDRVSHEKRPWPEWVRIATEPYTRTGE
jgi:acyl-CoA thioester hydrolase